MSGGIAFFEGARLMKLEEEILREHSRRHAERLARWVGNNRARFAELMTLFLKGEYRITQRSAWVVGICAEQKPDLIQPYLRKMVRRMQEPDVHPAVRRNVVRILQFIDIPDVLVGEVASVCFKYLGSGQEPVAVKAFSMFVLGRIVHQQPALARELRLLIEQQLPYGSPGFRSCARKVLKRLPVE